MAYSRKTWGARGTVPTDRTPKHTLVIHHSAGRSAGEFDTLAEQREHMRRLEQMHINQGWNTIGYNYVVFQPAGRLKRARVYEGRGWWGLPAAQYRANSGTVAVCVVMHSDQEKVRYWTKRRLLRIARRARQRGINRIRGHRDLTATACPGKGLYELLPWLREHSGLK